MRRAGTGIVDVEVWPIGQTDIVRAGIAEIKTLPPARRGGSWFVVRRGKNAERQSSATNHEPRTTNRSSSLRRGLGEQRQQARAEDRRRQRLGAAAALGRVVRAAGVFPGVERREQALGGGFVVEPA